MIDSGAGEYRDDDLLRADRVARQLYSEAVYTLATSPADLRTRIHDAYTGRAIHANTVVRLLPAHIGERVHLLAGRLGTHPDATTDEAAHAVWQALVAMDDEQLQDVARGIWFITHDLVRSPTAVGRHGPGTRHALTPRRGPTGLRPPRNGGCNPPCRNCFSYPAGHPIPRGDGAVPSFRPRSASD